MAYIAAHFFYLLLPGALIARLLRVKQEYLMWVALSWGLMVANMEGLRWIGIRYTDFTTLVNGEILLLAVMVLLLEWRRGGGYRHSVWQGIWGGSVVRLRRRKSLWAGAGIVAVTTVAYLLVVGPYTEVPADVWRHLGYIREVERGSDEGLLLYATPWYAFETWLIDLTNTGRVDHVWFATVANVLMFLLAIYWFAVCIFRRERLERRTRAAISVAGVICVVMHFGVNVFSYVRYYALAPTIVTMVVYFAGALLLLRAVECWRLSIRDVGILAVLFWTAYESHMQEAVFIYMMGIALIVVNAVKTYKTRGTLLGRVHDEIPASGMLAGRSVRWLLLVGALGSFAVVFVYSRYALPVKGSLSPWVIPLADIIPFVRNLYVANPTYQVYQVVSVWGVVVYLLFFLNYGGWRNNTFLLAGMLSPLVTVFNPAFVDIFVRHYPAHGIYRFAYMIPLGLAGGAVFVSAVMQLARAYSRLEVIRSIVIIGLLVGLLFPVENRLVTAPFSRVSTLGPVAEENDYTQWHDLIAYLNRKEGQAYVLTDPVTGYVISGLTHYAAPRFKFFRPTDYILDKEEISAETFERHKGWLLIINERSGGVSRNGAISGHWPKDILNTERYYSKKLKRLVADNKKTFVRLWSKDRIWVYRIQ